MRSGPLLLACLLMLTARSWGQSRTEWGENVDLWQKVTKSAESFSADSLWLGATFIRDTSKPFVVWLHNNEAGCKGALSFMVPGYQDSAYFLFYNKGNSGPTRVDLTDFDVPHLDTVYFSYRVVDASNSGCDTRPRYTGPNRRKGDPEGYTRFDRYSSDTRYAEPLPAPNDHITPYRRWCVAGWVQENGVPTDTVEFGFEDLTPGDADFDDIVFHITGIMLFYPPSLRLYASPTDPGAGDNRPLGSRDTVKAGETYELYAHVFDSTLSWRPDYGKYVSWELVDSLGNPVLSSSKGSGTAFSPTEAYGDATLNATFRHPGNPSHVIEASISLHIAPGDPHHISLQEDSVITSLRDDQSINAVELPEGVDSTVVYAIVRDRYGNFVGYADHAQWESANPSAVDVHAGEPPWHGVVLKQDEGVATVSATQDTLVPATLRAVARGLPSSHAGLVSAITRDTDGDGYLDAIELHFDTLIDAGTQALDALEAQVKQGKTSLPVTQIRSASGAPVDSVFTLTLQEVETASLQTGWRPRVSLSGGASMQPVDDYLSTDGAGPVLQAATFYPQPIDDSGGEKWDTIKVKVSEPVLCADVLSGSRTAEPAGMFVYYEEGKENPSALSTARFVGTCSAQYQTEYTLVLDGNEFAVEPMEDRMQLVSAVADSSSKAPPSREKSRKETVRWGVANTLRLSGSPNPFVPGRDEIPLQARTLYADILNGQNKGTVIGIVSLKPLQVRADGTYGRAVILDALGNAVVDNLAVGATDSPNDYGLFWDGRNRHGRYVGSGAYLLVVHATDIDGKETVNRVKIGVRR